MSRQPPRSHYSEADFVHTLRDGARPGGFPIDTLMPVREFKHTSDDEIDALHAYLRTVLPREYDNR
jgi:mono/diheme cytochrome c family protein